MRDLRFSGIVFKSDMWFLYFDLNKLIVKKLFLR